MLRRAASDDQGPFFGMEFIQLTPPQYKLIANLLYRDASVFEEFRQRRRNAKNVLARHAALRHVEPALLAARRPARHAQEAAGCRQGPRAGAGAAGGAAAAAAGGAAYPPAGQGVGGMSASVPHSMGQAGIGARLSLAPAGGVRPADLAQRIHGRTEAGEASGGAVVATLANFW